MSVTIPVIAGVLLPVLGLLAAMALVRVIKWLIGIIF